MDCAEDRTDLTFMRSFEAQLCLATFTVCVGERNALALLLDEVLLRCRHKGPGNGALTMIRRASFFASSSACPGSTRTLIRPYWHRRSAGNMSPVSAISIAIR